MLKTIHSMLKSKLIASLININSDNLDISAAPSSKENWVCTCKCEKSGITNLFQHFKKNTNLSKKQLWVYRC